MALQYDVMELTWTRIRHRVIQFFRTLLAPVLPVDTEYAAGYLTPELLSLFETMSRAEQQHGIALCKALESQGYKEPDLLATALLHDVGKTVATPYIWERVWVVLGERFAPTWAERLSTGEPKGLRRGFVIRRRHPYWGAELVAQHGGSERVVAWVRRHHDLPEDDVLLAALQAVDEQ